MTQNRRSKRAIRSRMAQTGEKYTEARRVLMSAVSTITWPQDSLGWFTDQAYNAVVLADDEARMLTHPSVDPEHVLLAATRYGNVERVLAGQGIDARAIHDVIVRIRVSAARWSSGPGARQPARRCCAGRSSRLRPGALSRRARSIC